MFTLNGLVEIAHRYRQQRKRSELSRVLSGLSDDIRKDIGWPASDLPVAREPGSPEQNRRFN